MPSASETTAKRKQRVLYADKVIQQTTFNNALKNHILRISAQKFNLKISGEKFVEKIGAEKFN
jgi:hypothetical protein